MNFSPKEDGRIITILSPCKLVHEQEYEENENTKFFWPQSQNVTDVSRGKRLENGYGGA